MKNNNLSVAEREVLLNGIRWANNILVELQSNYVRKMAPEDAERFRDATRALSSIELRPNHKENNS